jgi:hypothetical protein
MTERIDVIIFISIIVATVALAFMWNERISGLKAGCEHLGGVYINSNTCIVGENLFDVQ